jgi:hypothetical protein
MEAMEDPLLRTLSMKIFAKTRSRFTRAAAAFKMHHARRGGLLPLQWRGYRPVFNWREVPGPNKGRLVLAGDPYQLAPIGYGLVCHVLAGDGRVPQVDSARSIVRRSERGSRSSPQH